MAEFDAWAEYYDMVHQGLPGEAEFYVGLAVRAGGPALELGCGTGRIAIPMAMSGVDVTGLDCSSSMLDVCRDKLARVGDVPGSLRLVEGDMRAFDLGVAFDFVAMPYRTFMHLHARGDQLRCFACVREHLSVGGTFVFNTWVPHAPAIARAGSSEDYELADEYDLADSADVVMHYHRAEYDVPRRRIEESHVFERVDPDGAVMESNTLSLSRTWTPVDEVRALVNEAGLAVDAVFGDFDCAPLTESSTEMVWALKRG